MRSLVSGCTWSDGCTSRSRLRPNDLCSLVSTGQPGSAALLGRPRRSRRRPPTPRPATRADPAHQSGADRRAVVRVRAARARRRGWRISATPTTPASAASIACSRTHRRWRSSRITSKARGSRTSCASRKSARLQLDINAALCLIRQLVPAVALLHENARDVAHGLVAPERLIVTPHARLVIVEHVLRRGRRADAVRPRAAVAGVPRRDAAERRHPALRSARRRDRHRRRRARRSSSAGRSRADEYPHGLPALLNEARERTRARRRAAAVAAAALVARARAAGRRAPRVRVRAGSAGRARGGHRRRLHLRRRAGRARDVPVAVHRGAAGAAVPQPRDYVPHRPLRPDAPVGARAAPAPCSRP